MTKEKIQLAVIAVGIVILIALAASSLKKKPSKGQAQESVPAAQSLSASPGKADSRGEPFLPASSADENDLALQKERIKLEWGRDPFSSSRTARDYQRASLELKGISLGKNKNGFAFINSEIVKKGDTIGEYEVTEIQRNRVMLRKGQQSFYLVMPRE
ncbi:hypothetical protein EPN16_03190 [bacterium]|nr:MAG: hypothetical protein EPN16_03190 [bacterium]